jgi:hypothetical protein
MKCQIPTLICQTINVWNDVIFNMFGTVVFHDPVEIWFASCLDTNYSLRHDLLFVLIVSKYITFNVHLGIYYV